MNSEKLKEILELHKLWIIGDPKGGRADLRETNLRGADLEGADLEGANLRRADLYGADLYGADLRGADLRGADLRGANLEGAYLEGANLYGADLRGAYLEGANLRRAYLRRAYLEGADLRGADLYGANLYGADLGLLKFYEEITIQTAHEAIEIAEDLFWCWETKGIGYTKILFQAHQVPNEDRALIVFHPDFKSGWCYVMERKQIWIWNWSCPDPSSVPIIWDENWKEV